MAIMWQCVYLQNDFTLAFAVINSSEITLQNVDNCQICSSWVASQNIICCSVFSSSKMQSYWSMLGPFQVANIQGDLGQGFLSLSTHRNMRNLTQHIVSLAVQPYLQGREIDSNVSSCGGERQKGQEGVKQRYIRHSQGLICFFPIKPDLGQRYICQIEPSF